MSEHVTAYLKLMALFQQRNGRSYRNVDDADQLLKLMDELDMAKKGKGKGGKGKGGKGC